MKVRLHILGIPHTITRDEYSHCAFTGKVQRFSPMMKSRDFEVYHYGVKTSVSGADKDIDLLTVEEWNNLRVKSYKELNDNLSIEEIKVKLEEKSSFVGDIANWDTSLYKEFNRRLKLSLKEHYRSTKTDIVCLPFGPAHEAAIRGLDVICVESGIGYPNSYKNYRIFESYAKLHWMLAKEDKKVQNYWFVVPNYYDITQWSLNLTPSTNTVGFFGRICHIKGCEIIVEIARKFPHVRFILCGQGDPTPYLKEPNIIYKEPIHGTDRSEYLSNLVALVAPTYFVEPFCGVSVEAQLCGTPVLSHDCGALVETVENFKTGLHCHTLSDFCYGVQMAVDNKFDRTYIRERAVKLYDMYNVAINYEYAFKTILDVHNGKNGWYSPDTYIDIKKN